MEIACGFQKAFYQSGLGYTLEITSLRNIHPNTKIASFIGNHEDGLHNAHVAALNCSKVEMHYVPAGLFQRFANLEKLTIYYSTLKEISRQDLAELKNLKTLSITYCPITALPNDLFADTEKLNNVNLSSNKIESASSKLLEPFVGRVMRLFDLRDNKTISAHYSQDDGSVKSLEEFMQLIDEKCGEKEKCEPQEKCGMDEKKPLSEFETNIRSLWPSGRFSDFEVIAGSKKFQVHKNILGLQSSVFAKIFDENRQATEMKIPDFSETVVENVLHFLYTAELKEDGDVFEMFSISAKLEVPELKKIYEKKLEGILKYCDELAAYEIFLCAHQNTSAELKLQSFKTIEKLFARDLPEDLIDNPEKFKAMIVKKIEFDQMFK